MSKGHIDTWFALPLSLVVDLARLLTCPFQSRLDVSLALLDHLPKTIKIRSASVEHIVRLL